MNVAAEAALGADAEEVELALHPCAQAGCEAVFHLFDLIAETGIDEIGEVVEEIQV